MTEHRTERMKKGLEARTRSSPLMLWTTSVSPQPSTWHILEWVTICGVGIEHKSGISKYILLTGLIALKGQMLSSTQSIMLRTDKGMFFYCIEDREGTQTIPLSEWGKENACTHREIQVHTDTVWQQPVECQVQYIIAEVQRTEAELSSWLKGWGNGQFRSCQWHVGVI